MKKLGIALNLHLSNKKISALAIKVLMNEYLREMKTAKGGRPKKNAK